MSYGTCIGEIIVHPVTGEKAYLLSRNGHSNSTHQHLYAIQAAIPDTETVFRIDTQRGRDHIVKYNGYGSDPAESFRETGMQVMREYIAQGDEFTAKARRARENKASYFAQSLQAYESAQRAAQWFNLTSNALDALNLDVLRARVAEEDEKLEAIRAEKQRQAELKEKENYELWKSGQLAYGSFYNSPIALRLDPKDKTTVESTHGARVPVTDVIRAWNFIKVRRAKGWKTNGETFAVSHYALQSINEHGVIIGCHRIAWNEIDRFAAVLGLS